jgi:hypothetical protein
MVGPQFPGQTPGQQGMQRLQQQQREMMQRQRERQMQAAWDASQRTMDDSVTGRRAGTEMPPIGPTDRLGFFGRFFRGLFLLVGWIVTITLLVATVLNFVDGTTEVGMVAGGLTLLALLITRGISKWGRR